MKPKDIETLAVDALNNLKAIDLITIDVRDMTSITDSMIICTGSSNRHVKSLADNVVKAAKASHLNYIKTEGEEDGEWVVVDLADVVVHIMLPAMRTFYHLEDLWEPIHAMRNTGTE